jgi:hypothetical protein
MRILLQPTMNTKNEIWMTCNLITNFFYKRNKISRDIKKLKENSEPKRFEIVISALLKNGQSTKLRP